MILYNIDLPGGVKPPVPQPAPINGEFATWSFDTLEKAVKCPSNPTQMSIDKNKWKWCMSQCSVKYSKSWVTQNYKYSKRWVTQNVKYSKRWITQIF